MSWKLIKAKFNRPATQAEIVAISWAVVVFVLFLLLTVVL